MDEALVLRLFVVVKNLYDLLGMQQAQMDILATELGIDPHETADNPAVAKVQSEIAELEKLFNSKGKP